jgi:hypothetical protein
MKKKQAAAKIIQIRANQIKPPTKEDLNRLKRAAAGPIDTSDIAEMRFTKKGPIWHAVVDEMRRQGLSGHRLWKLAREYSPKLPESAVYEFMANKRSVRVDYADAMLQALGLKLTPSRQKRAG